MDARDSANDARYDLIGRGYARTRREDPVLKARILEALGDARSVLNVGAGTGSYEPDDRMVIALEPSKVMAAQRPRGRFPPLRAGAQAIPLHDGAVDAAMAILSLHHWDADQEAGVREMCRVARQRVVSVTVDPVVSRRQHWLLRDYLVETAQLDDAIFPSPLRVADWLVGGRIEIVPVPRDTPDWTLMSFWAHPERVLDPTARAATSGFARQPAEIVDRVVNDVRRDLASGAWDARNGHLRALDEYDVGLRLIVSERQCLDRAASGT